MGYKRKRKSKITKSKPRTQRPGSEDPGNREVIRGGVYWPRADPAVIPEKKKDRIGGFEGVGVGVGIAFFQGLRKLWVSSGGALRAHETRLLHIHEGIVDQRAELERIFRLFGFKDSLSRKAIIPWVLETRLEEVVETKQMCEIAAAESQRGDLNQKSLNRGSNFFLKSSV